MTIGQHSVVLIPDPDAQAWGDVLNSNAYFTTDLAGWRQQTLTPPWVWDASGAASNPNDATSGAWLTRSETAPIARGASTLFRVTARVTVAAAGRIAGGAYFGDTPLAAATGPFWSAGHAALAETIQSVSGPGSYVFQYTFDPSNISPAYTYIGPQIHFDKGMHPVIDSFELVGQGAESIDISCLVDQVTIHHGRDDTDSQPDASSCTLDISLDTGDTEFPASLDVGGIIRVVTTTPQITSTRFQGRITDISQGWAEAGPDTPNAALAQVIATGTLSELGRRTVGDVPWPQELDGARLARIMSAAGYTLDPTTSDPGTVQILARDVDSQTALDLAQAVAADASGILWATRDGQIRYADADHRRGATASLQLDACDVLVTPTWRRTTEGLVNDVSIGYGLAAAGADQPRYTAERTDSKAKYGEYGFTTTTQLAALADAEAMGQLLLTRNREPVWVLGSLPLDMRKLSEDETGTLLGLDINDLFSLTGMPAAGNVPTTALLWVEGWSETLAWDTHELEIVVSGYCRTSPAPRWNDLNAGQVWDSMGSLTWDEATCMGPIPSQGRWDDQPASLRWNQAGLSSWDAWPL